MLHAVFESDPLWTRRRWLQAAGALTVGTTLARTLPAAAERGKESSPHIEIGILMGTFSRPTLEAALVAVKAAGLACVQLSMSSAGLPMMPDAIPPELTGRIRREAESRGITIASLEGTFNMSHPDPEHRRAGLRRLRVLAGACRAIGTSKVHVCTGTRDRDNMWKRHADNDSAEAWRDMVACVRAASEIARQAGVILAFEPEVNNVVDSAKKARRLLDEIGSPHLKVTIDGANIFHAGELARMSEVLDEAFALLGKDIALAHAKDLSRDGDAGHEAAGRGKLDYDRYLSLLVACGYRGPLLLHGLSEAQVPGCVAFLRDKLARVAPASERPVRGAS
ncbi:MAG: sugar phosphate isomerase/epimerase family protein [Pirellulales bacterium]